MRSECFRRVLHFTLLLCLVIGLLVLVMLTDRNRKTTLSASISLVSSSRKLDDITLSSKTDADDVISGHGKHGRPTAEDDDSLDYSILLNLGRDNSSGQVYIQHGDKLGFLCTDGFGQNEARVVCRELGYKKGLHYNLLRQTNYQHYTEYKPILSGLHCSGNESRLKECGKFDLTDDAMNCSWIAAVVCYNGENPYELRLVNTRDPDSGLVEMKLGGVWGVVCAIRTFDDELADILCRNMNYTGGITMKRGRLGSINHTTVWAPYIYCDVGEPVKQSIFDCHLILHTENILKDKIDLRNNIYLHEYKQCIDRPNSYAAAVQCLQL